MGPKKTFRQKKTGENRVKVREKNLAERLRIARDGLQQQRNGRKKIRKKNMLSCESDHNCQKLQAKMVEKKMKSRPKMSYFFQVWLMVRSHILRLG